MLEDLLGGRALGGIEGEERGEEVDAGVGEERELGADERRRRVRVGIAGQAECFHVRQAAERWPGFVGGEAAELEDLVRRLGVSRWVVRIVVTGWTEGRRALYNSSTSLLP